MKNVVGIYYIENIKNNKKYIGQSVNILKEWRGAHRPALRYNRHHNPHLQRAWNKYGEDSFRHVILLICEKEDLYYYETMLIEKFNSHCSKEGYNISLGGESVMTGRNHTDESKLKMSISKQNISEETRVRISEAGIGRKTNGASSIYHGVTKRTVNKNKNVYWRAIIKNGKKCIHIGNFKSEIEAAIAYNDYVLGNNLNKPINVFQGG